MLAYRSQYHIEDAFKQMKNPHFLHWSPMFHWTDSKIRVHAFYCLLALTLTSVLQREVCHTGQPLSINRLLEELGGIRETLIVYPRRQGQRQNSTATCLTRMSPLQQRLFSLLDLQRYEPPSTAEPLQLGHTDLFPASDWNRSTCLFLGSLTCKLPLA